jgi:hypothetical protein
MLFDPEYKLRSTVTRVFSGFDFDHLAEMNLGKHHWNFLKADLRLPPPYVDRSIALEIIRFIVQRRLKDVEFLNKIISKEKYEEHIKQDLDKLDEIEQVAKKEKGEEEDESEEESEEEESEEQDDDDEDEEEESEEEDEPVDGKQRKKKKKKALLNDWGKQPTSWAGVDRDDRANFLQINQTE